MQIRKSERFGIMSLVVLALVARLFAIYHFGPSLIKFGDAADYLSAAHSLCSAGSYPDRSSLPFFRAPGLPFFIAGATLCHPERIWLVKVALALIDTLSVVMIFLLAEQLFQNRRTSFLSAAAAAIYPFFLVQVCDVQSEGLFMFLLLAGVWLTLRGTPAPNVWLMFLAGACAAAAALVRPVGLVLLPVLLASSIFVGTAKRKDLMRLLASFAIGAVLILGPWVLRNASHYRELILVNDAGGYNFWRGTSPEMEAIGRVDDPEAYSIASIQFETVTSPAIALEIDRMAGTPSSRSREWYRRSLESLAADPGAFFLRLLRNGLAYWRPWLNPQTYSTAIVITTGFLMTALDLLALIGWRLLQRRNRRLALWCAAAALLFWILQIPFQVVSRLRIPITDPFLIIFAAASLTVITTKWGRSATPADNPIS
jgi:4-amino-4-deoxy-L-arabinose transferase-like glycosyltransferase